MKSPTGLRKRKPALEAEKASVSSCSDADVSDAEIFEDKVKPPQPMDLKKVATRMAAGLAMIAFYMGMLRAGHFYCILVAVLLQFEIFRELINVRYVEAKEKKMPLFRTIQWSWFLLAMLFVYGESFHNFCVDNAHLHKLTSITGLLNYIAFILYCLMFIVTVFSLRNGMIRFQLSQLMWTLVTICMVVFQCKFLAVNAINGLFWYFFPYATIVMNDISAYFFGILFGRKFIHAPFFSLSPNKTWEGFLGAAMCTVVFAFFFPTVLAKYTWFTCPVHDLYIWQVPPPLTCNVNPVFLPKMYRITSESTPILMNLVYKLLSVSSGLVDKLSGFGVLLSPTSVSFVLLPIQLHGIAYGLFASFIAPFGGFLASAIKRAYNRKDFEAFLPGHGGAMDRMDCALVMVFFTSFHYRTFIENKLHSVGHLVNLVQMLPVADQLQVLSELQNRLKDAIP